MPVNGSVSESWAAVWPSTFTMGYTTPGTPSSNTYTLQCSGSGGSVTSKLTVILAYPKVQSSTMCATDGKLYDIDACNLVLYLVNTCLGHPCIAGNSTCGQ